MPSRFEKLQVAVQQWLTRPFDIGTAVVHRFGDAYCLLLLLFLWYKSTTYVYIPSFVVQEICVLVLQQLMHRIQWAFCRRSVRSKEAIHFFAIFFIGFAIVFIIGYHLTYQVMVLRVEVGLCATFLALEGLEAIVALVLGIASTTEVPDWILLSAGFVLQFAMLFIAVGLHVGLKGARAI